MPHANDDIPRIRILTDQEVLNAVILDSGWTPQPHESLAVTVVNALPVSVGDIEIGAVNILDVGNVTINPATEETLQLIGSISEGGRPKYFVEDSVQTAQVNKEYNFGASMRDIWIYVSEEATLRFNATTEPAIELGPGEYDFTAQFAEKVFITNTVDMDVEIYANGGV